MVVLQIFVQAMEDLLVNSQLNSTQLNWVKIDNDYWCFPPPPTRKTFNNVLQSFLLFTFLSDHQPPKLLIGHFVSDSSFSLDWNMI